MPTRIIITGNSSIDRLIIMRRLLMLILLTATTSSIGNRHETLLQLCNDSKDFNGDFVDEKWEAAEDFVGSADCQILARELGDVALVYRQTTGESVSQAFHHVGVSLGGILDNLISMVKQLNNPEKLKSKKTDDEDHTFVPNRAKSNYFSNQKCRSRSSDPCYVTARGQEFACGVPNRPLSGRSNMSRIINGEEARPNEFPWIASLHYYNKSGSKTRFSFCAGVLISNRFVLTAGHCIEKRRITSYYVVLGKHDTRSRSVSEEYFMILKTIIHDDFNPRTLENDIGLIHLARRVVFNRFIRPACFPIESLDLDNRTATVAGWGRTSEVKPRNPPETLIKIEIPIVPLNVCKEESGWKSTKEVSITSEMVCAGNGITAKAEDLTMDACQGDSGGPMTITSDDTGQHMLVGIVSFGQGCGLRKFPGVYTRVGSYINWIGRHTKDSCFCDIDREEGSH